MTRTSKRPIQERLDKQAREDRGKALMMPPCQERDALLRRAKQMEKASDITGWLDSAELRPPD